MNKNKIAFLCLTMTGVVSAVRASTNEQSSLTSDNSVSTSQMTDADPTNEASARTTASVIPHPVIRLLPFPGPNDSYEGSVNASGLPDGKGVVVFANGETYEGDWVDGRRGGTRYVYGREGDEV